MFDAPYMTEEQSLLAKELVSAATFKWRPGMMRVHHCPGHLSHGHREGYYNGGYVFEHDVPDLADAATAGVLLSLLPLHQVQRQTLAWRVSYDSTWEKSIKVVDACTGSTIGEAAAKALLALAETLTPMETLREALL